MGGGGGVTLVCWCCKARQPYRSVPLVLAVFVAQEVKKQRAFFFSFCSQDFLGQREHSVRRLCTARLRAKKGYGYREEEGEGISSLCYYADLWRLLYSKSSLYGGVWIHALEALGLALWLQARNLQGLPIVDGFMGGENGTREPRYACAREELNPIPSSPSFPPPNSVNSI